MSFTITVDDEQVRAALARLRSHTGNLQPALEKIGERLVESTQARFFTSTAPDGTPWAANSDTTISRYLGLTQGNFKKNGSRSKKGEARASGKKPLVEGGSLRDEIHFNVSGNVLEVGSVLEYGLIQQKGGRKSEFPHLWGDIPARPFLGLSAADKAMIDQTVAEYLDL